ASLPADLSYSFKMQARMPALPGSLKVIVIAARALAALARALPSAQLRKLVGAVASQAREREGERPCALAAQPRFERVVVKLNSAAIPPIADVAPRVHEPPL